MTPAWVIAIKEQRDQGPDSEAERSWTIGTVPSNWREVNQKSFEIRMAHIGPVKMPSNQREVNDESFEVEVISSGRSMTSIDSVELISSGRSMTSIDNFELTDGPYKSAMASVKQDKREFLIRLLRGKLEPRRSSGDAWRTTECNSVSEGDDSGRMANAVLLDDLVAAMGSLEQETRAYYSESFKPAANFADISSSDFVEMMVVDGCFVVELLRLYYDLPRTKSAGVAIGDNPIFNDPHKLTTLRRDLLLLENQLPFFVLKKLYELINKKNNTVHQKVVPLEELAVTFFNPLLPQGNAASKLSTENSKAHLLEVFHSTFLKSVSEKVNKKGQNPNGGLRGLVLHFASELKEAGVQFKKRKGHDLLDIEFRRGTLWVPPLSIDDHTFSLLSNFVAYELRVEHPTPIFTNYLMFWTSLINSPEDVQILHNNGIINNALGSEKDVANLLIRCREVIYDRDLCHLYDEIKGVNEFCERYHESQSRIWWRSLMRERFSSPWTCLSLFAAIILLLLTALQTFYTVYPYYRPH